MRQSEAFFLAMAAYQKQALLEKFQLEATLKAQEKEQKVQNTISPKEKQKKLDKIQEKQLKKEEKLTKKLDKQKELVAHTQRVAGLCLAFGGYWNDLSTDPSFSSLGYQEDRLIDAAYLHDILKLDATVDSDLEKRHHEKAVLFPYLQQWSSLQSTESSKPLIYLPEEEVFDVISCHKGALSWVIFQETVHTHLSATNQVPLDTQELQIRLLEGCILRICDKLDKFQKSSPSKALQSCEESKVLILSLLEQGELQSYQSSFLETYTHFLADYR